MGQCFQGIGLTKGNSIIAKLCPNNAFCMKANFNKCIRDYLEAVAGFLNKGDQLIRWLRTSMKPALMPMHKFTQHWVQLFSYIDGGYFCQTMNVPTAQEKSEQIFFAQPKVQQKKFANLNKMVPTDPLKMIAFFEQCQATDKVAGVLKKIAKDKQPKERKGKQLSFLSHVAMNQANINIAVINIMTIIKTTDVTAMINDPTIIIKTIDTTIALNATTRT